MTTRSDRGLRRKIFSHSMVVLSGLAIVAVMLPLFWIIYECVVLGGSHLTLNYFTQGTPPPCSPISCEAGGGLTMIQGSFIVVALATLYAVPIGIAAAIFAVEYGGGGALGALSRALSMAADVLSGVPSIVIGVFVYVLILYYDHGIVFSVTSGSLALGAIMLPIVMRTTEEALRTVPHSVREAALALGMTRWKISLRIVLISALPGVLTGILLAIARAVGEAAPLLLLDNTTLPRFLGFNYPAQSLSLGIYLWADSPYKNLQNLAWETALVLLIFVLVLSLTSRLALNRLSRKWKA